MSSPRSKSLSPRGRAAPPQAPRLGRAVPEHLARQLGALLAPPDGDDLPARLVALLARLKEVLGGDREPVAPWFREGILAAAPSLRNFALSLTGNMDRAEDLVQDTILKALDKRDTFQDGTNLQAWLFTILRNSLYTQHRRRKREAEDPHGTLAARLRTRPDQFHKLEVQDLWAALEHLSPEHREAILLVGVEGLAYEEVAALCGVPVGTVKSRVNRGRARLAELMGYTDDDLAADPVLQAASGAQG